MPVPPTWIPRLPDWPLFFSPGFTYTQLLEFRDLIAAKLSRYAFSG
jgi:hypothetical protein